MTTPEISVHRIISAAGVTRIHVTIDSTTHVLDPVDAAVLALKVKEEVPTTVSVEGDRLTIEMGYNAMSCNVDTAIAALLSACRVMDHRKVQELQVIEDAADMEHAWTEIGKMAKDCVAFGE